ncbi:LOW QUALITY PROTEIN: menin-like [Uloborus diversus]|uniref:LOW QUALITY PROTEIN: menin-like n=1 Tax=Uloborus diversus TaxID=327109 RepID=UPI00240A091B|nr:LOW QUALITY PROTEIN: menin-like [Uloborus diversus]
MAGLTETVKRHFPLKNVRDVIQLFQSQIEDYDEPNLALLSIVAGYIENMLTCNRTLPSNNDVENALELMFPVVDFSTVEALYEKFKCQIKGTVDLTQYKSSKFASRDLVKKVSDIIWGSLTRSYYKDRAHLQSLFSYLTGNKLDCFGVAFAVVAAFQVLGYKDVHLALSEDHAWVIYGKDSEETAEVTWHGKGNEDKRGQPVATGMAEKSWLYLNGYPVKCTRRMEVAALVSGINPSINAMSDSLEVARLQQQLLWLLYDLNHLKTYPMALGNLGDLEEITPSPGRPPPIDLFQESILAAQSFYCNMHVYPYTYLGGYLYRNGRYKGALEAWANAADVIRKYNYGREDEEIYKEFLEIANELIPHIVKVVSTNGCEPSGQTETPLLQDPDCFAYLLKFYDGLCEWEEGSSTPVLHIGWAKPLVSTISKFPGKVRSIVDIAVPGSKLEADLDVDDHEKSEEKRLLEKTNNKVTKENSINGSSDNKSSKNLTKSKTISFESEGSKNKVKKASAGQETEFLQTLETQLNSDEEPHPNIRALAAACGDNILNPEYLLGSGEPFSSHSSNASSTEAHDVLNAKSNGTPAFDVNTESNLNAESVTKFSEDLDGASDSACVTLMSQKMKRLKDLLLAEKLNTSAIQLQLTAQSQVQVLKRGRQTNEIDFLSGGRSTKRSRRD